MVEVKKKYLLSAARLEQVKAALAESSHLISTVDIQLAEKITDELGGHGCRPDTLTTINRARGLYYLASVFDYLLRSGGLTAFFDVEIGGMVDETIDALRSFGETAAAEILIEARSRWPDGAVPRDMDSRTNWTMKVDEDETFFDDLNERYYDIGDTCSGRVSFTVQHPELFYAI